MKSQEPNGLRRPRNVWLAIIASVIAFAGTKSLLLVLVLIILGAVDATASAKSESWLVLSNIVETPEWFLGQSLVFASAGVAGVACSWLSRPGSNVAFWVCVALALTYVSLDQVPHTISSTAFWVWFLALPIGLAAGYYGTNYANRKA